MTNFVNIKAKVNVYITRCERSVDNELESILEDMMEKLSHICEVDKAKDIDIDSDDSFSVTFDVKGTGIESSIPATRFDPPEYDLDTELYNAESIFDSLDFAKFRVHLEIVDVENG